MADDGKGMRALILVGGFGTRLRPLTFTVPKPLVPFCNKPMIIHQVEALKEAGVTEVIFAVAYRPEAMKAEMDEWGKKLGISFVFSIEEEPLGTAGPLGLAKDILLQDDKPFFVLNSDVTCRFPMREALAFHRKHGHEGTIMVTKVDDWEKYGVVVHDKDTQMIEQFVEKPKKFVGDRINAGIYIFNKSILSRIPSRRCSIEKEIFPLMSKDKQLFAFNLEGFWKDIGQPADFIDGISMFLPSLVGTTREPATLYNEGQAKPESAHFTVIGCNMIAESATIGAGSVIGPHAVIGANCHVGPACRIERSAIFAGSIIGTGTFISDSIVGWNNRIGSWCHVEDITVTGDDVGLADGKCITHGVRVLPNKDVGQSYNKGEIIM